jgi:reversibly glycosylated polypeptide/UDP-arabinopyranose mutase
MKILVVPTIREENIQTFLNAWNRPGLWDQIIVVEDNPQRTFDISGENVQHYCWEDIDNDFEGDAWIISRRDSGIKCFGFYKAFFMGAEYIYCMDDDCLPSGIGRSAAYEYQAKHLQNLNSTPRWTESVQGMRTRGIPYHNLGSLPNVVFSVGLWEGVPDLDALCSLTQGVPVDFKPTPLTRIMPRHQYFPFCGMNFAFKRSAAPLCYFPLMGKESPYGRFDDIWFGVIAKKICDHLDLLISCGEPFVRHERASNVFTSLVKEAPGIKMNENYWQIIDSIKLTGDTPLDCMYETGNGLRGNEDAYLSRLGDALITWVDLFGDGR